MKAMRLLFVLLFAAKVCTDVRAQDAMDIDRAEEAALQEDLGSTERKFYWYNDATLESQRAKPEYEFTDPESGDVYYYCPLTKETSWDKPDSLKWAEVEAADGKGTYYYNEGTAASQWETPAMLAWRRVSVEDGDLPEDLHGEL